MKAAPKPADTAAVATPAKPSVAKSSSQTPGSASGTAAGEGKSSAHLGAAIGTGNGKTTLAGSGNQLKSLAGGGGDAAFADNGDGTYRITGKGKLDIVILNDAHPVYPPYRPFFATTVRRSTPAARTVSITCTMRPTSSVRSGISTTTGAFPSSVFRASSAGPSDSIEVG